MTKQHQKGDDHLSDSATLLTEVLNHEVLSFFDLTVHDRRLAG
ncbi:MAG: hypothetical protein ACI8P0_006194 [Planctomycetaceae bacterium]